MWEEKLSNVAAYSITFILFCLSSDFFSLKHGCFNVFLLSLLKLPIWKKLLQYKLVQFDNNVVDCWAKRAEKNKGMVFRGEKLIPGSRAEWGVGLLEGVWSIVGKTRLIFCFPTDLAATHLNFPMTPGWLWTSPLENSLVKHPRRAKCHISLSENDGNLFFSSPPPPPGWNLKHTFTVHIFCLLKKQDSNWFTGCAECFASRQPLCVCVSAIVVPLSMVWSKTFTQTVSPSMI